MKGTLNGEIKKMHRDNNWVYLTVETTGAVEVKGVDAKASGAEITLRVKPLVGNEMKFGDKISFTWSTEKL